MYTGFRSRPLAEHVSDPAGDVGSEREARNDGKRGAGPKNRVPGFVWGLGVVSLFTDASTEMVGSSLPLYLSTWLRVGPLALAGVDAAQHAMTAIMRVMTSLVADRTRRHRFVAGVGYTTSLIARLLLVFGLPTSAVVASSVAVDRVGKGIRTGPRDAMIASGTPSKWLGSAFGVHRALDAAGAFLGPLLAYGILRSTRGTGFHAVFVVAALVGFMGVVSLALLVTPSSTAPALPRPDSHDRPKARSKPFTFTLRRSGLPVGLMVLGGVVGCFTAGDSLVLIALLRSAKLSNTTYPLLAVAASLTFAVLAGPFGRMSDRVRPLWMYLGGLAILAVTYLGLGSRLPRSQGMVLVVLAAIGCFYAATDGVLAAAVARVGPSGQRATAQAAVQTASSLGRAVGSGFFGLLWARHGIGSAFRVFGLALCVVAIGAVVIIHRNAVQQVRGKTEL